MRNYVLYRVHLLINRVRATHALKNTLISKTDTTIYKQQNVKLTTGNFEKMTSSIRSKWENTSI
jgi:hypothetical protein